MNVISILIGLFALLWGVIAFVPLLGWMYWGVIPIALVGLAFGVLAQGKGGRNLNLVVIIIGLIRLSIGGGLF